jgi:hypothetical protein
LTVLLTVLVPPFAEVTTTFALTVPVLRNLALTVTVFVAPAAIGPTAVLTETPLPEIFARTAVAAAVPELLIATL